MNKPGKWNFNGAVTQHYGLICLLTGTIGGIGGLSYWLYLVWTGESEFRGGVFFGIIFFSSLISVIGYVLLRIGYEEED